MSIAFQKERARGRGGRRGAGAGRRCRRGEHPRAARLRGGGARKSHLRELQGRARPAEERRRREIARRATTVVPRATAEPAGNDTQGPRTLSIAARRVVASLARFLQTYGLEYPSWTTGQLFTATPRFFWFGCEKTTSSTLASSRRPSAQTRAACSTRCRA